MVKDGFDLGGIAHGKVGLSYGGNNWGWHLSFDPSNE